MCSMPVCCTKCFPRQPELYRDPVLINQQMKEKKERKYHYMHVLVDIWVDNTIKYKNQQKFNQIVYKIVLIS